MESEKSLAEMLNNGRKEALVSTIGAFMQMVYKERYTDEEIVEALTNYLFERGDEKLVKCLEQVSSTIPD